MKIIVQQLYHLFKGWIKYSYKNSYINEIINLKNNKLKCYDTHIYNIISTAIIKISYIIIRFNITQYRL